MTFLFLAARSLSSASLAFTDLTFSRSSGALLGQFGLDRLDLFEELGALLGQFLGLLSLSCRLLRILAALGPFPLQINSKLVALGDDFADAGQPFDEAFEESDHG